MLGFLSLTDPDYVAAGNKEFGAGATEGAQSVTDVQTEAEQAAAAKQKSADEVAKSQRESDKMLAEKKIGAGIAANTESYTGARTRITDEIKNAEESVKSGDYDPKQTTQTLSGLQANLQNLDTAWQKHAQSDPTGSFQVPSASFSLNGQLGEDALTPAAAKARGGKRESEYNAGIIEAKAASAPPKSEKLPASRLTAQKEVDESLEGLSEQKKNYLSAQAGLAMSPYDLGDPEVANKIRASKYQPAKDAFDRASNEFTSTRKATAEKYAGLVSSVKSGEWGDDMTGELNSIAGLMNGADVMDINNHAQFRAVTKGLADALFRKQDAGQPLTPAETERLSRLNKITQMFHLGDNIVEPGGALSPEQAPQPENIAPPTPGLSEADRTKALGLPTTGMPPLSGNTNMLGTINLSGGQQ